MDLDLAPVFASGVALDESQPLAAGDQRYDAVVVGLQPLRQFRDRCPVPPALAFDVQHQQVLQVGHARAAGDLLAPADEAAQLVAEVR